MNKKDLGLTEAKGQSTMPRTEIASNEKAQKLFNDNKENKKRLKAAARANGMKSERQKNALFLRNQDGHLKTYEILNVWEIGQ